MNTDNFTNGFTQLLQNTVEETQNLKHASASVTHLLATLLKHPLMTSALAKTTIQKPALQQAVASELAKQATTSASTQPTFDRSIQ